MSARSIERGGARRVAIALALLAALGCRAPASAGTGSTAPASAGAGAPRQPGESAGPLGSDRNARVAVPIDPAAPAELSFLAGELTDADVAELRALAPNVRIAVGLSREQALARAAEWHGVDARYATSELIGAAPKLRWVAAWSAGVERYLAVPELRDAERIVLTNMKGMHGPAIADHAFAMLLALARDLPSHWKAQAEGRWDRGDRGDRGERGAPGQDGAREARAEPFALAGRTLLVVGLGGIGTEVARRAKGFDMRVLATRRSAATAPDFVDEVGLADALGGFLPRADVIALCVPLTPETEGLIGADELALVRPGAILINVSRGKVCDTDALVEALRSGRLGGACLDVTDPEPLPREHPMWTMPNVWITPHVSARAALTDERSRALFRENFRRFGAGLPLLNVVDPAAGY